MKPLPLFLFSFLMVVAPAMADDAPMPSVSSESDFDATCIQALVNKQDKTPSCVGFRRAVLSDGAIMFMMRIDEHTVMFTGKLGPTPADDRQILSVDKTFIDDAALLADGSCTLAGDLKAHSTLICVVSAVAQGHGFTFQVSFTSKGLLPLKPSKD